MLWTASVRELMVSVPLQASLGNLPQVEKLCRALLVAGIASAAAPGRRLRSRAFAPECQARHRVSHALQSPIVLGDACGAEPLCMNARHAPG